MDRDEVDRALARVREEKARISVNLVELENNVGHQFLQGATLHGITEQRWVTAREQIANLWRHFHAYENVIDSAERLRSARSRPSTPDLTELTRLLSGRSVTLQRNQDSLADGSLLDSGTDSYTLAEIVAEMTAAYDAATEMVAAADAAWKVLLPQLQELTQAKAELDTVLVRLELSHPEHERIGTDITELQDRVRGDPLSLSTDTATETPTGTSAFDQLRSDISALHNELAEAQRLRDTHDTRIQQLRDSIAEVASATEHAEQLRAHVHSRVADPLPQQVPVPAPNLRDQLATLDELRSAGQWPRLAAQLIELEKETQESLRRVRAVEQSNNGLLERRAELRGRLDAYQMKANRLGQAEADGLVQLYQQARDLLWTAPSDLRTATVILAQYQRVIQGYESDGTS